MAGPSGRTSRILKLAMDAAKISEDQIETDDDPFLDSGSDYQPESDSTDEEIDENSSPKRKRFKKEIAKKKSKQNTDTFFENQEQVLIRTEQHDKNQTQNINDPKELVQIIQKEPKEKEREVGDQQIIGDKTRNESDEVEEQQITEMERAINIPDVVKVNKRIREKKSRKLSAQPKTLKRNINMSNREKGKEYTDYKNRRVPEKTSAVGKMLCTEKCRLKCNNNFAEDGRITLFNQYYSLPTTDAKNVYLFGCLKPFDVKQRTGNNAYRQKSFRYFLTLDGKSTQVCKSAFLKLLNVGRKKVELIRNQISQGQAIPHKDQRGCHNNRKNQTPNEQLDKVRQHIKSFPAEMSHYSRNKNEHRLYLSPMLSINKMYELYRNQCAEQNIQFVKNSRYRQIFVSEFNLGFGSPKSDTCKVCDATETKNDEHVRRYKTAFEEQKKDRKLAYDGTILYINFDMQKTLPLPKLSTSVAFYLRQVWLYNLGIHCVSKGDAFGKGFFHLWTEDKGGRGPEEVGSSVLSFLQSINNENDHLVAWSDSAGGQNKNFFVICLWHYLIHQGIFKTVDHKFPEVGHSFMDIDRDFGAVEKVIRKAQNIYTVDQYMTLMTEARKRNPFVLTRMEDKFIDLKELPKRLNLLNRKKSNKGEKILFRNARWIRVDKFGTTKYRYSLDETEAWKEKYVNKYRGRKLRDLEPHVFALAEAAYSSLQADIPGKGRNNQSLVISGESGAGKTESTRFILQYLCSVTSGVSTWVEQQILEANTILEAFGNAKTVRNDNSSRFGKFMQVCFDSRWMIAGCIIQDYLLEQSRITFQGTGERNYHVFYQLVEEAKHNSEFANQLHLKEAKFYNYLNQSDCIRIEGDSRRLDSLRLAFNVLQVPSNKCSGIFQTLSAILWLGNLTFEDIDGERCQLTKEDENIVEILSKLLGLEIENIKQVVLLRQINVRGNITEIPLKLQEARENRHAMAKALYSKTFAWLINHINNCTNPGQDSTRFLGVLDIFGFENFAVNSFEQLCINYTNEKLHKFFNHYVFALEQEIYSQEEIQFDHISFTDNTLCLELLEKPPRCILRLLSEQCHLPRGCDASYISNLHSEFGNHERYVKGDDRRKWETEFGVKHYAGCVTYNAKGFVDKNRDVQQDVFFDIISRSSNEFVQDLYIYQDIANTLTLRNGANGVSTVSRGTSKGKPTVSDTFRHQLQALVDVLQSTTPWYVRCIKPNKHKLPDDYDDRLVLDQLKYLGMLDIIRIRKEGFPIHMSFEDFVIRYHCLSKNRLPPDMIRACKNLIDSHNVPKTEWQLGKTKVFMRSHVHEPLEEARNRLVRTRAILIQKTYRRYVARKEYTKIRNATLRIQHAYKGWKMRIEFLRKRRAAIVIQSHLRGVFAREVAAALREMRRVEEEMRKREKLEEERKQREIERREREAREAEEARRLMEEHQLSELPPPPPALFSQDDADLEESEKAAEQEIAALSQMAEQLKQSRPEGATESVDLDNLFAFLSDVHPNSRNQIIDEIGEKMNELVEDLDVELETVIQQELEGLAQELQQPTPPKMGLPTLPEPTGPPPPPPPAAFQAIAEPPVIIPEQVEAKTDEPIYEAVLPREEPVPVCVSPPPLPAPPRLSSDSPKPTPNVSRSNSGLVSLPNWRFSNDNQQQQQQQDVQTNVDREQRRKFRVEKKLQELNENNEKELSNSEDLHHDMVEFANNYFNSHERSPEGTIIATLTRKRQSSEMIPKYEMVTFYKGNTIPNSHVHLYDPDNINIACSMFRDLNKYIRGEVNGERELQIIQSIIGYALEREELRDEVFVQCIRQATNNPNSDGTERVWLLLCLCVVSFQPSKLLFRYFLSFLKKNLTQPGRISQYVQWCLDNCNNNKVTVREHPPSSVEVAAMKRLGTIVCRFFFLDGRTKAIDVHPTDTAGDAARKLAERLGLRHLDGWAIYQSRPDGEEHVRAHHYLYDVIAQWELNQNKLMPHGGLSSLGRKSGQAVSGGENRFIFKRRLFKSSRELSQDPVEVNLLYAQAVHSIVKCDDFPVTEKVALQLAGLQAQVALGNPKDNNKLEYYTDIDTFLPYRISRTRGEDVWVPIVAQAHRQYGANRTELTAKALYLSCVMQYPLYGTTMFSVTYRGYWSYGNALTLGINCEGIMLIKNDDKFVLNEFLYQDVESILLDPSDSFITITLQRHLNDNNHKCYVFETAQKNEIGSLIASYCPSLAGWLTEIETPLKKMKSITNEDRVRLYHNLVNCRRALVDHDILRKPTDTSGSFLRNTLRRLSKHKLDKLRQEHGGDSGETYKGFHYAFWAFSRQQLPQSISRIPEADEQIMLQVFQIILTYAGLGQNGETIRRVEDEHVTLLQTILERCMRKESLLCELYLQLVKQTTDHPDPNSRINLRHWALLSLACSVVLPPNKAIRRYLIAHLKRCSSDFVTEEGKYARFAEKCLGKTQGTRRRQWPPSREEILCTINRRPVYARFHFMDGQYHSVEFHPSATAKDVLEDVRDKIGLYQDAKGYAIYEVLGNSERSLAAEEKVADVMAKWERYRAASAATAANNTGTAKRARPQHHFFLFKKHLFMDIFINLNDPVEKELLYHQVLHDLRTDRFPITDKEAMMLTALQAQLELGDLEEVIHDYRPIAAHCLPARMVPVLPCEGVQMHHQSLRGMTPSEAKQAFLNLIQSWPLHKATIFDVMQSFTSNWPRVLWLAVDQKGLHLLEHRSRNTLCTYEYASILSYAPALNCLMIITGSDRKQSKVILTTAQAFQIATLIKEYMEVLQGTAIEMRRAEQPKSRPVSALHPNAPLVPPQPS